ncbi:MAG: hypothetical protein WAO21_11995 [Verrucomicrobiia bacterium]
MDQSLAVLTGPPNRSAHLFIQAKPSVPRASIIWLARAVNVVRPVSLRLHIDCARSARDGRLGFTLGICTVLSRPGELLPIVCRHSYDWSTEGVIFDTNASWDENAIWYMCENSRVAAFGSQMGIVHYISKNDIVFLYHKNQGIIAAGKVVTKKVTENEDEEVFYHGLEWLTARPVRGMPFKSMPAWQIKEVLDRNFFWARTIKTPYLSSEESATLLKALIDHIGPKS